MLLLLVLLQLEQIKWSLWKKVRVLDHNCCVNEVAEEWESWYKAESYCSFLICVRISGCSAWIKTSFSYVTCVCRFLWTVENILLRNNNNHRGKKCACFDVFFFISHIFDLNRYFDLWRICLDMMGSCSCSRTLEILRINCARVHVLSSYNITKQAIECVVWFFVRSLERPYQFSSSFRNFGSKDYWHEVLAKRVNKFFVQTIYKIFTVDHEASANDARAHTTTKKLQHWFDFGIAQSHVTHAFQRYIGFVVALPWILS